MDNQRLLNIMQRIQAGMQQAQQSGDQQRMIEFGKLMEQASGVAERAQAGGIEAISPVPQQPLGRVMMDSVPQELPPTNPLDVWMNPQQAGPMQGVPTQPPKQQGMVAPQDSHHMPPKPQQFDRRMADEFGPLNQNVAVPKQQPPVMGPHPNPSPVPSFTPDGGELGSLSGYAPSGPIVEPTLKWIDQQYNNLGPQYPFVSQPRVDDLGPEDVHGMDNLFEGDTVMPGADLYRLAQDPRFYKFSDHEIPGYSPSPDPETNEQQATEKDFGQKRYYDPELEPNKPEPDKGGGFGWMDFLGLLAGGRNYLQHKMANDARKEGLAQQKEFHLDNMAMQKENNAANRELREADLAIGMQNNEAKREFERQDAERKSLDNYTRAAMQSMTTDPNKDPIVLSQRQRLLAQQGRQVGKTEVKKGK